MGALDFANPADSWAWTARAAVAGTGWHLLSSHAEPGQTPASAQYAHGSTGERRTASLDPKTILRTEDQLDEIRRQLKIQ
jgi:hypothetical protein